MVAQNPSFVDEGLFAFLEYVMQVASMGNQPGGETEKLDALHEYLTQETEYGRQLARRSSVVRGFADDPTRDSLLSALAEAPDEETVHVLVQAGMSLMDYAFFQKLNQWIDEATNPESQQDLQKLRRQILDQRDVLMKQGEEAVRDRAVLLQKLVSTEDPRRMASSHLSELDDLFFTVVGAQMRDAQQAGDEAALRDLQRVAAAVNEVMESTMPPEIALTRRLMAAPSDEQLDKQLTSIRELLTPAFLQFLGALEESLNAQGQSDSAARVAKIQARARQIAPAVPNAQLMEQPQATGTSRESDTTTPSGLIIAKH